MFNAFASARLWLANLDPAAPAVALMLSVFLTIYSVRRWLPRVWIFVESTVPFVDSLDYRPAATILWKAWQAWPAALLGAVTAALSTGGSVTGAVKGCFLGIAVALVHEFVKAYQGKVGDPKPPTGRGTAITGLCFVLTLVLACGLPGCSVFGPGASVWPKIGACAPPTDDLFSKVESILIANGTDWESDLLDLGKSAGPDGLKFVECAVKAVLSNLGSKSRITSDESVGVDRAKAFIAKREAEK